MMLVPAGVDVRVGHDTGLRLRGVAPLDDSDHDRLALIRPALGSEGELVRDLAASRSAADGDDDEDPADDDGTHRSHLRARALRRPHQSGVHTLWLGARHAGLPPLPRHGLRAKTDGA